MMTSNRLVDVTLSGAVRCAHPTASRLIHAAVTQILRIGPVVILYCERMAGQTTTPPGGADDVADPDLTRSYVLIIVVEILVVGGLYWVSQ